MGDHATHHVSYDAPLQSDIETIARNVSPWVRTSMRTDQLARDAVEAIAAAIGPPGQVATLIVPADVAWAGGRTADGAGAPRRAGSRAGRRGRGGRAGDPIRAGERGSCSAGGPCVSAG